MGVELQLVEAVGELERARREAPDARASDAERLVEDLQAELARSADEICRAGPLHSSHTVGG